MGCKLTSGITKLNCNYSLAGVKALYLINYDSSNKYTIDEAAGSDTKGAIATIELATGEKAYKVEFVENTASFTDDLAVNGNGGKYRTHTLNFTVDQYTYEMMNTGDALSLGKYTAVVVDKNGRAMMLGRVNGLNATVFNYASGAAEADANGWTVTMAGTETEIAKRLKDESVVKAVAQEVITTP